MNRRELLKTAIAAPAVAALPAVVPAAAAASATLPAGVVVAQQAINLIDAGFMSTSEAERLLMSAMIRYQDDIRRILRDGGR